MKKFRVWDQTVNKYDSQIYNIGEQFGHPSCGDWIAEMGTGLKDGKGKEIFQGDIVQWSDYQGWEDGRTFYGIYVVEWDEEKAGFILSDPFESYKWPIDDTDFDHVIGNIHENPKMLPTEPSDEMVELG